MTIFLFYLFSGILVISSVLVITSKNPIHSVLFLILCFFNSSILFLFLNAEFLAMILLIVYVGAVAVLFLFVVMMLDIKVSQARKNLLNYLPLGLFVSFVIFFEFIVIIKNSKIVPFIAKDKNIENKICSSILNKLLESQEDNIKLLDEGIDINTEELRGESTTTEPPFIVGIRDILTRINNSEINVKNLQK